MTEIQFATIAVALISLIFSGVPFVQLVYFMSASGIMVWDDWYMVTFIQVMVTAGATLYRRLS